MLGAFLVRSGVLTSVHAFAVDPTRGTLLLIILAVAAGSGFVLFAWRAPSLPPGGLFAPVSREGALVLNNLFLSAAVVSVVLGTLYPLVRQALSGQSISVGAPYYGLTFGPLMAAALLILPAGPLLAWKRGDLTGALQRLAWAAALAVAAGLLALLVASPGKAVSAAGVLLGAWLVAGSLAEVAHRAGFGRLKTAQAGQRLLRLPRAEWGMTLAHLGIGVFVIGACCELSLRTEAAKVLTPGQSFRAGAYVLSLSDVTPVQGPNFTAERAALQVSGPGGARFDVAPERRFYPAQRQTTSKVAIRRQGGRDLYVVLGERQDVGGHPAWLVRVFFNPLARLIFAGPLLMALGGLVSLSDRRLRLAVGRKAVTPALVAAE
jgi:cytochrome c-type biogenesis protein CcmF